MVRRWERGPLVAQKAPAGVNHVRSLQPAVAAVEQEEQVVVTAPVQVVQVVLEARREVVMTMVMMMTPTNAGRQGVEVSSQNS